MRVISGTARSLQLKTIEGMNTRPTTDRIKETLFNILSNYLRNCKVLDLYSGSGALGIEALSRGAKEAVFVDENKECIDIIKENLQHTKLIDLANIYNSKVEELLVQLGKNEQKFDIIFMDPPYNKDYINNTIEIILQQDILNKEGLVIIERASEDNIKDFESLELIKEKVYKKTILTFLRKC